MEDKVYYFNKMFYYLKSEMLLLLLSLTWKLIRWTIWKQSGKVNIYILLRISLKISPNSFSFWFSI